MRVFIVWWRLPAVLWHILQPLQWDLPEGQFRVHFHEILLLRGIYICLWNMKEPAISNWNFGVWALRFILCGITDLRGHGTLHSNRATRWKSLNVLWKDIKVLYIFPCLIYNYYTLYLKKNKFTCLILNILHKNILRKNELQNNLFKKHTTNRNYQCPITFQSKIMVEIST